MKILRNLATMPTAFALFYLPLMEKADHYLDPGTGSIIVQVVIGLAVGGLATVGIFWARIRTKVKNLFSKGNDRERTDE